MERLSQIFRCLDRTAIVVVGVILVLASVANAHAQSRTVTARWDANTDSHTTGYQVYYGTSSGNYGQNLNAGNVTSVPLTLQQGATYYFVVRAYNASLQFGPPSTEVTFTVASTTPPTAQLTATLSGSNTAAVSWQTANATSVTLNGAGVAGSGSATYTIGATTTYTLVATGPGGSVTRTATVSPSPVDCVVSAWSFQSATAWGACTGGQQSRTESWARSVITAPANGGAACGALTEQRVAVQACGTTPTAQLTATLSGSNTAAVSWQTANATSVTLNGAGVAGTGSATFTISATTTYTLVATGPGGSVTRTATVSPSPVDCVVSAWSFQSATAWGACTGGQQSRTESWARSVITAPANGGAACGALTEQRVAVQTCSDPTRTAPGAPVNVTSTVSGSRVTLGWSPSSTGGAATGYYVSAGTTPGGSNIVSGLAVGNVLSVSGYLPRGTYFVRVRAGNAVGRSADSTEAEVQVGARTPPRRPGGFTGSLDNSVVTLSWSAPVGDAADGPTGYIIEAGSAPGASDLARLPVGNTGSFRAVVSPGIYYVRVRAVNELGTGDPSDEIVLQPGPGAGRPLNLISSGEGSLVTLSWQAPSVGEVPVGYVIEAGEGPGLANLAVLHVGNATTFSTTAPPGTYYVRVRAVSALGVAGEASNQIVVQR